MESAQRLRALAGAALIAVALATLAPPFFTAEAMEATTHRFELTGALGTPVPFQATRAVAADGSLRLDLAMPQGAVAEIQADARTGTVHLYRLTPDEARGDSLVPAYILGDPVPATRKSLVIAGPASIVVDPGPGATYRIDVTIRGAWGDARTGSPAPITVTAVRTWGCPLTIPTLCPP